MKRLYGVIPAAGCGVRAWPESLSTPKGMFLIDGIPLVQHTVELMRDQMGISDIVIVTGYMGAMLEDHFGDGSQWGVRLSFIRNRNLDRGLAWSVFLSRDFVDGYFCVILGDEYYQGSNHRQMVATDCRGGLGMCAVKRNAKLADIRGNYTVQIGIDGRICQLIEKPVAPPNNYLGCGTFILSPALFPLLEKAWQEEGNLYLDFITQLNIFCQQGALLFPFWLEGCYVNINDRASLDRALFLHSSVG